MKGLSAFLLSLLLTGPSFAGTTWRTWPLNTTACDPANAAHPCALEMDILSVMKGGTTQSNYRTVLDPDFGGWSNKGSNNLPVLAAAISLWKGEAIGTKTAQAWWDTFLTCQTNSNACGYTNALRYFNGYEILSPIYNAPTVAAVASVRFWAMTRDANLFSKSTTYLKMTSALYALAAGTGPARTAVTDSFTLTSQPGICPPTFTANRTTGPCDSGSAGGVFYDGPFLALAGGRSFYTSCANSSGQGDREPIFVRAVQWPGVTRSTEGRAQEDLLDYIETNWPTSQSTNAYGNDASRRLLLQNHVKGVPYDPGTIVAILRGARFIREYRFLTWPGVRVTLLSSNPDNCGKWCTAAMFAVKYDANTAQAQYLYPWPGDIRTDITQGYGRLTPSNGSPTSVVARDIDPALGEVATCTHGDTSVTMSLPPGSPLFQVVLTPNADAIIQ